MIAVGLVFGKCIEENGLTLKSIYLPSISTTSTSSIAPLPHTVKDSEVLLSQARIKRSDVEPSRVGRNEMQMSIAFPAYR